MYNWVNWLQIVIIGIVAYGFYRIFIRNTSSEKLVRGLLGIAAIWALSFVFAWARLAILASFTHWAALFMSVALVVIFQPELRKFLALMGNMRGLSKIFSERTRPSKSELEHALDEIVTATEFMSAKKTGALMVFQNAADDGIIERPGVRIDATISSELLLTIFFNKTPLHDGAVLIRDGRIYSAGAILPVAQENMNWKYGTRHRAALGMSQATNALVLVVSEESGTISVAEHGEFTKYDDMKKLRARLERTIKR